MKKSPSSTGQRNSLPQLRGAHARQWRRSLAASAKKQSDTVRTLKFKLESPESATISFDNIKKLNTVVDGVGLGSLTGLLLTAHCVGFRIFPQEGGAVRFRQTAAGTGQGFAEAFKKVTGLQITGIDPPGLQARFRKKPRARRQGHQFQPIRDRR